tara:strand:- start:2754 stop:5069 length:2316 start_codon:yes stop_codon:yes gene_type:complete
MKINIFSTKGQTLKNLKIKNGKIPKLYVFKVSEYIHNNHNIINFISKNFNQDIVVRSSNYFEDKKKKSFAGYFDSVLNVSPKNKIEVKKAINKVIKSYKSYRSQNNEVLIQHMIKNAKLSGVVTTCDVKDLSPYYSININYGSDTTAVTSGKKNTKEIIISKSSKIKIKGYYKKIINLSKELEKKFLSNNLDIEFAITKSNIYLLQVRPIVSDIKNHNLKNNLEENLLKLKNKIIKLQNKNLNLFGKTTFFGVMSDWNPAEMIGIKPKPLALSLYEELITDLVWAENRRDMGFKDMTSNPLMTNFFGTPFIDIRVDFNSWLPEGLPHKTNEKLVNYYLNLFRQNTDLHDKVEFEILLTCFTPSTNQKLKNLRKEKFTEKEIKLIREKLININLIAFEQFEKNIEKIEKLKKKQLIIKNSKKHFIDKINWYIEDCKKYGTYPFAGLARCGFIAIELLNSFVKEKIISEEDKNNFLQSLDTVTSNIIFDNNKLTQKKFLSIYGHLRPNTYEISSLNYKDGYKIYFKRKREIFNKKIKKNKFNFNKAQLKKVSKFLKKNKIDINNNDLEAFIRKSIQYREYSKFIFTKNIDLIFEELKKFFKKLGLNKNDLSFLEIKDILNLYNNLDNQNVSYKLKESINKNKSQYYFNQNIKLPEIITNWKDIYFFKEKNNKTNFIGKKNIVGKVKILKMRNNIKLDNKIVCIESADPGYDFIFNQKIKGLVTKFGGKNSHMAIRSSELGLPAAIGVGNFLYKKFEDDITVELNCEQNKIDFI